MKHDKASQVPGASLCYHSTVVTPDATLTVVLNGTNYQQEVNNIRLSK